MCGCEIPRLILENIFHESQAKDSAFGVIVLSRYVCSGGGGPFVFEGCVACVEVFQLEVVVDVLQDVLAVVGSGVEVGDVVAVEVNVNKRPVRLVLVIWDQ